MLLELVGSGVIAVVVAILTALFAMRGQRDRLARDHAAQLERLREELKLAFSIETAIKHLMNNPNYKQRNLKKIKHHLRGFKDNDELRMHLIRAGAVAFGGVGEDERWGLLSNNEEDVK